MKYAEIVVSNRHFDDAFSYRIPEDMVDRLQRGCRVLVPFGTSNKNIEGYVVGFTDKPGIDEAKIKDIIRPMDDYPLLNDEMLQLAFWMKEKYYTSLYNCINCIAPAVVKPKIKPLPKNMSVAKAADYELTSQQREAIDRIICIYEDGSLKPVLLHGVTGSGKTEVYMSVISYVLKQGKQAIVLVPEISLTPQIISRFMSRFGDTAGVTHSRMSYGERYEQWRMAKKGEISIMIGPRSAVFTPFDNLGIIIIDEEQEHTYKSEISPKYSTSEVALRRCGMLVLGSATPSVNTYYEAAAGNMELIELTERVNRRMPDVHIADMRMELAEANTSVFAKGLKERIERSLIKKEQIILFLNRRGHSTFVSCRKCGHVMGCGQCNVNYTYHLNVDRLICHYCGKGEKNPDICPICGSKYIKYFGLGTQKLENEVKKEFPDAKLLRMDMDTTSKKNSHAKLIAEFASGGADILIGTQMIAKGLDFPNVSTVGIIAADISLNQGDFRSAEITYQLLTQVSGRAGRADVKGEVYIQTYNPEHYSIIYAQNSNYAEFYKHEILLRERMSYPPFSHIFNVLFISESEKNIIISLNKLLGLMRRFNKKGMFEMLGPAPAVISKIKNKYRWKLLVKCEEEEKLRLFVMYCIGKLKDYEDLTGITMNLAMDPMILD